MKNKNTTKTGTGDNTGFEFEQTLDLSSLYDGHLTNNYFPEVDTIVSTIYTGKNNSFAVFGTGLKTDILVSLSTTESAVIDSLEKGQEVDVLIKQIIDTKRETIMYGSVSEVLDFTHNAKVLSTLETYAANKETLVGIPIGYTSQNGGYNNNYNSGYDIAVNIEYGETLIHMPHLLTDINKLPNPDSIIGQEIEFHVLKDEKLGFVASRKSYLQSLAKKEIKNLKIGEVYTGFVTGTRPYAIFIQIGNCTGMVHETNLGEEGQRLLHEGKIVPGMQIDVYLKDISNGKLTLTQIWRESIWNTIKNGNTYEGTIDYISHFSNGDFGVLVKLDFETKGMIHSSNLSGTSDDYVIGTKMNVKVQNVYKQKRQITLIKA